MLPSFSTAQIFLRGKFWERKWDEKGIIDAALRCILQLHLTSRYFLETPLPTTSEIHSEMLSAFDTCISCFIFQNTPFLAIETGHHTGCSFDSTTLLHCTFLTYWIYECSCTTTESSFAFCHKISDDWKICSDTTTSLCLGTMLRYISSEKRRSAQ